MMDHDEGVEVRVCKVIKWSDFNGYGFNLHAEKGKAGQYVGKVDEGSPAQLAGLKEHDRIVAVNGSNINNENHQQVVNRIKEGGTQAELTVVDRLSDAYFTRTKTLVSDELPCTRRIECPPTRPVADAAANNDEPDNEEERVNGQPDRASSESPPPPPPPVESEVVPQTFIGSETVPTDREPQEAEAAEPRISPTHRGMHFAAAEPSAVAEEEISDDLKEMTVNDDSERDPIPEPEPREPEVVPEPVRVPTPEPERAPTPEPERVPTPEPERVPTPEPIKAPSPEPVRAPEPVKRQSNPEPAATVEPPAPDPTKGMSAKEMREVLKNKGRKQNLNATDKLSAKARYEMFQKL